MTYQSIYLIMAIPHPRNIMIKENIQKGKKKELILFKDKGGPQMTLLPNYLFPLDFLALRLADPIFLLPLRGRFL
jgi:hypothetical protein